MNQAEYERNEAELHVCRMAEIESAPLPDRQEAREAFAEALRARPVQVADRAAWILAGHYGYGACQAAKRIQVNTRMNRVAALCQLVAALEWQCPPAFARQAWRSLSLTQRKRANRAIEQAVQTEAAIT